MLALKTISIDDIVLIAIWRHYSFFFCSAQNKSDSNQSKSGTRTLGNQVIRKGNLCIQNLGIMKGKIECKMIEKQTHNRNFIWPKRIIQIVFPFFHFILCFVFFWDLILKSCVAFSKTIKTLSFRFVVFWIYISTLTLSLCLSSHSINANFRCLVHRIWFLLTHTHDDLDFLSKFRSDEEKFTDMRWKIEIWWKWMMQ